VLRFKVLYSWHNGTTSSCIIQIGNLAETLHVNCYPTFNLSNVALLYLGTDTFHESVIIPLCAIAK